MIPNLELNINGERVRMAEYIASGAAEIVRAMARSDGAEFRERVNHLAKRVVEAVEATEFFQGILPGNRHIVQVIVTASVMHTVAAAVRLVMVRFVGESTKSVLDN